MTGSRNELATWALAVLALAAWAGGSHWLVAVNKPGAWLDWLWLAQHVGFNLVFGLLFGRTLLPGRTPLVTAIARRVHEVMTPALIAYTRGVTRAWTLFFLAMTTLSVLLFAFAPIEAWSFFANILGFPLVVLMFAAEYEVRKRALPPEDRVGLIETVRAFRAAMKS